MLLAILLAASAHDPRLVAAIERYESADFAGARDALIELVEQLPEAERETARCYLAASYLSLGDRGSARMQLRLVYERPSPALFPPELVQLWQPPPAPPPPPLPPPSERRSLLLLPFGVPQFQRGHTATGVALLTSELTLFATSAVALGLLESLKVSGTPFIDGTFRSADVPQARLLNDLYSTAFFVGVAVVIAGIVEAVLEEHP